LFWLYDFVFIWNIRILTGMTERIAFENISAAFAALRLSFADRHCHRLLNFILLFYTLLIHREQVDPTP
jgi:hypothetical protein